MYSSPRDLQGHEDRTGRTDAPGLTGTVMGHYHLSLNGTNRPWSGWFPSQTYRSVSWSKGDEVKALKLLEDQDKIFVAISGMEKNLGIILPILS
jgi:hypothetical protein